MSELPVRGIIVEDCQEKFDALHTAFQQAGGQLIAHAASYDAAVDLINQGMFSPQAIDTAFIDADLGIRRSEGRHLHLMLCRLGYATGNQASPDPHRIVTVGASSVPYMAQEVGTPSLTTGEPLVIEWDYVPLVAANLPQIMQEVRQLKPSEQ